MSVSEFQSYLVKYKKFLAILVSVAILGCGIVVNSSQSYTAEVYIKYLGENAEEGVTENGSELNPYEISNTIVVLNVLTSIGENEADCESVRKGIDVVPIAFTSEEEKYESWKENFSSYEDTEEKKHLPCITK